MATRNEAEAYEAEVKRTRDTYGPDAEIPHSPYGQIGSSIPRMPGALNAPTAPTATPAQRIADLAAQVAEAGRALEVARVAFDKAQENRAGAEHMFIEVSERLMQAIHAHREGADENQPYGLR